MTAAVLPANNDGTVATIMLVVAAVVVVVIILAAVLAAVLAPRPVTPAEPEPAEPKTCQLRFLGRVCGVVAYFHDRHIDGTWVWTCTGCHDRGVAHGYLNNDPKDVIA